MLTMPWIVKLRTVLAVLNSPRKHIIVFKWMLLILSELVLFHLVIAERLNVFVGRLCSLIASFIMLAIMVCNYLNIIICCDARGSLKTRLLRLEACVHETMKL